MKVLAVLAALGALALASNASAKDYTWSFVGDGSSSSGVFSTDATDTLVVSASGTFTQGAYANEAIVLYPKATPTQSVSPDGRWFYDNAYGINAANGWLLVDPTDSTVFINIWANSATQFADSSAPATQGLSAQGNYVDTGLGGVLTLSAAPEPAAWALLMIGVGAMGAALRTRRRTVEI